MAKYGSRCLASGTHIGESESLQIIRPSSALKLHDGKDQTFSLGNGSHFKLVIQK